MSLEELLSSIGIPDWDVDPSEVLTINSSKDQLNAMISDLTGPPRVPERIPENKQFTVSLVTQGKNFEVRYGIDKEDGYEEIGIKIVTPTGIWEKIHKVLVIQEEQE